MNKKSYIEELCVRYPELNPLKDKIKCAVDIMLMSYNSGGKILICGNGGSAADAEHISGELLKGFILKRIPDEEDLERLSSVLGEDSKKLQRGVPAIPLTSLSSVLSAYANDVDPSLVFAQLAYALGRQGDVLICISTSGNSTNVVKAASAARALGISTVALTGEGGGKLGGICDITLNVPATETYNVQEYHLPLYHAICAEIENVLFNK